MIKEYLEKKFLIFKNNIFLQIKAGYQALKTISGCIDKGKTSGGEITQACNDFYTRIPHEFGFRVPPIIRTHEELKKKLGLLEALSDIQG